MAGVIYGLCAATAFLSAYLLLRSSVRSKSRLLLWSGLCFVGLALNNSLIMIDRYVLPEYDLSTVRLVPALAGMALLIYGLICEAE